MDYERSRTTKKKHERKVLALNDEWKVDSTGRKYKEVGHGLREYQMDLIVSGTGAYIPKKQAAEPNRTCPFMGMASITMRCSKDCAFYDNGRCGFGDTLNTKGRCPISGRRCRNDCGLYHNNKCRLGQKG